MRNKIRDKLKELDNNVFYGIVPENIEITDWNYFVFGQRTIRKKATDSTDLNGYWYVVIVRENFIPDDDVFNVISKMEEISGLRLADGDCQYNYVTKGNSNMIVEILELQFTKTKKRCN